MDDRPPPWESALEAYRRTHPYKEDELDAAFASFDANVQDSGVVLPRPADSGIEPAPAPEQLPLDAPDLGISLAEARRRVTAKMAEGTTCPCCGQTVKIYRRKLTSVAVRMVLALYREAGMDYGHVPTVAARRMRDVAHQGGYITLGGYWGLIEEEKVNRPDGGRAGYWRVTQLGEDFIQGHVAVAKYAEVYDGRVRALTGHRITAVDALGEHFDLQELLRA